MPYRIETDKWKRCVITRQVIIDEENEYWESVVVVYKTKLPGVYFEDWEQTAATVLYALNAAEGGFK